MGLSIQSSHRHRSHGSGSAFTTPRPAPQLAQNREVEGFAAAAAWPNAEPAVPITAAQEFMASRHDPRRRFHLQRLAREQPDRPVLTSLERCAPCRRAAPARFRSCSAWAGWKRRSASCTGAPEAEPVAGQLLRGLVFADLPRSASARRSRQSRISRRHSPDARPFRSKSIAGYSGRWRVPGGRSATKSVRERCCGAPGTPPQTRPPSRETSRSARKRDPGSPSRNSSGKQMECTSRKASISRTSASWWIRRA